MTALDVTRRPCVERVHPSSLDLGRGYVADGPRGWGRDGASTPPQRKDNLARRNRSFCSRTLCERANHPAAWVFTTGLEIDAQPRPQRAARAQSPCATARRWPWSKPSRWRRPHNMGGRPAQATRSHRVREGGLCCGNPLIERMRRDSFASRTLLGPHLDLPSSNSKSKAFTVKPSLGRKSPYPPEPVRSRHKRSAGRAPGSEVARPTRRNSPSNVSRGHFARWPVAT
jgi:hypothetical protein